MKSRVQQGDLTHPDGEKTAECVLSGKGVCEICSSQAKNLIRLCQRGMTRAA
jgi:hypothetical protein